MKEINSEYINEKRRNYSLYVLQFRAIPNLADGLKASARRVLWTAKHGKKTKSATLAGATMPIHPHAAPEDVINTLAAPYGNNMPLLKGSGAFGTLLDPKEYGASRYTSVTVSDFGKDVVFCDIDIIPMKANYDDTLQEPVHFLPLIPLILLNAQDGIGVGFACNILPHELGDILKEQIRYLEGKPVRNIIPYNKPTNDKAIDNGVKTSSGTIKYTFEGDYEKLSSSSIRITKLPYGLSYSSFENNLMKLREGDLIKDVIDSSSENYDIEIKFKRGTDLSRESVLNMLGLTYSQNENLTVINFNGNSVLTTDTKSIIEKFTEWRLSWFVARYERLADLLDKEIQKYKDIITAIDKNVGGVAKKTKTRGELVEYLDTIKIVHVDYIADLPVYRFTLDEKSKTENKLKEAEHLMKQYQKLLKSESERKKQYITELQDISDKYNKGSYNINYDD